MKDPKTRTFAGKSYEITGMPPYKPNKKHTLQKWAIFQRRVNRHGVRIIKSKSGKGYQAYISKSRLKR